MSRIEFEGQEIVADKGETVLEALLRHDVPVANGCRSGVCQSCVMEVVEGEVPASAQRSLNERQKTLNHFLSCQCHVEAPLKVSRTDTIEHRDEAEVLDKYWLNDDVICLKIAYDRRFHGGQYLTFWKDDLIARSYSIANIPGDGVVECHIKHFKQGAFSHWLAESVKVGDTLQVQGPMGTCIYSGQQEKPLLLAGIGTGIAPLLGILRAALANGHEAPIHFIAGFRTADSLYARETLAALEEKHANLKVDYLIQKHCQRLPKGVRQGDIYREAAELVSTNTNWQAHLCGAETFVKNMRKNLFLAGVGMADISADAFLISGEAG